MKSIQAVQIDDVEATQVGPGCTIGQLPSTEAIRVWVVDMAPGSEWPRIDVHDESGEEIFVVSGELIEGDQRFGPGTYLFYGPGSSHRPRTETGVRLIGFNLVMAPGPGNE